MTIGRSWRTVLGGMLLAAMAAAPADASSIVHIRDGNVWLANPDGSGARQVTVDGTAGNAYSSPSQADDGTLVAAQGATSLVRMDRQGRKLPAPTLDDPPGVTATAIDPRVSPDGSKIAYHWIATPCDFCGGLRTGSQFAWADRFTPSGEFGTQRPYTNPSWMTGARVLVFSGSGAYVADLGTGPDNAQLWFDDTEYIPRPDEDLYNEGEITRAGDKIALGGGLGTSGRPSGSIRLFATNGTFPAKPTSRCAIVNPNGSFRNLTWSPDGGALAWADDNGIWTLPVPNLDDCPSLRAALVIPGGQQPDWGPAAVGTGERGCGRGNCPPPPPGETLRLTGLRVTPRSFTVRRGARISFRLTMPAAVSLRFQRLVPGRRRAGKCVTLGRSRRRPNCTRAVRVRGTLAPKGAKGANRLVFAGRVAGRRLAVGRYRVTANAHAGDRRSTPMTTTFSIRR